MIQATIRNFRGVTEAEFDIGGIVILGGDNGAGKSSIAQAMISALTGEVPINGLKKTDYPRLVHTGTATAYAEIKNATGRAVMAFPEGKAFTEGQPPHSTPYATGLVTPLDMKPKDAAEAWATLLETEPTPERLETALKAQALENTEPVTAAVKARGWDGAHAQFKDDGSRYKGRWEQITGERYGKNKAEGWAPYPIPPGTTQATLEQAVKEALAVHEQAIKSAALAGDIQGRLEADAGQLEERRKALAGAETALKDAQAAYDKEYAAYRDMPEPGAAPLECPHCSKPVRMQGGKLVVAVTLPPEAKAQREAAAGRCDKLKAALNGATENVMRIRSAIAQSEAAAAKLKENAGKVAADTQATAAALGNAQNALKAWTAAHDAAQAHEKVLWHIAVVEILAPEGLRKRCLDDALRDFNAELLALANTAKWPAVTIEPDLSVSYGGRPYLMLSESEQYGTRAVIQAAIAMRDGSEVLIFDRADILTKAGRNGLFRLCKATGLRCLMLMSASTPDELPRLKDGNATLWIEQGVVRPVS